MTERNWLSVSLLLAHEKPQHRGGWVDGFGGGCALAHVLVLNGFCRDYQEVHDSLRRGLAMQMLENKFPILNAVVHPPSVRVRRLDDLGYHLHPVVGSTLSAPLKSVIMAINDRTQYTLADLATWVRWLEQAEEAGQELHELRYIIGYHDRVMAGLEPLGKPGERTFPGALWIPRTNEADQFLPWIPEKVGDSSQTDEEIDLPAAVTPVATGKPKPVMV